MPIISRFYGIIIFIFWRDHCPPHFHAKYAEEEITMEIQSGIVNGSMVKRALNLIDEWRIIHVTELMEEWKLAEQRKSLFTITPLE
jgi:hypothetical protein